MEEKKNGSTSGFRVDDLSWNPGNAEKKILDTVELELEPGHFYGILGPNGAGKTSLLKHLLKLYDSKNAVFLNEIGLENWKQRDLAKELSYVPQNTAIEADFSVEEIVAMGRYPHRNRWERTTPEDADIVEYAMQATNVAAFREQSVATLSGGELQRVLAARAIAQDAEWIFLDEPVAHMDLKHQMELMELMKLQCNEAGKTIVAVLHDINLAVRYCDRLILMKNGRIYASGETELTAVKANFMEIYDLDFKEWKDEAGGVFWQAMLKVDPQIKMQ